VGAGLGVHFVSIGNPGPGVDDSRTDAGGHITSAPRWSPRAEPVLRRVEAGIGDSPDFKAMAGWSFTLK
jgi:hypothetical protein